MRAATESRGRSPIVVALVSAVFLVAIYNGRFWSETLALSQSGSLRDWMFVASVFVVLVAMHVSALLLIPGTRLLKAFLVFAVLAGAISAYFANTYGAGIDAEMIRNTVQTDAREAAGLMTVRFGLYMLFLAVVPAIVVLRTRVASPPLGRQILQRVGVVAASVALCGIVVASMGAQYASFLREHKALRYLIAPGNVINGGIGYFRQGSSTDVPSEVADLESPVSRTAAATKKPLVMFVVIGETARAQNFQLGGYAQATNPELSKRGVHYFTNAYSCGTSTAVSLPCMFSGSGRKDFDAARAARGTNLVDALAKAGIAVEWRDNNSGCKGLCARVPSIDYRSTSSATFCSATGCYDEVMLADLPEALAKVTADTVIVFHQAGSHGPAYSERYPKAFEVFKPVCYGKELSRCAREEVVNAYDNSLLYTDHNVARQIDLLKSAASSVDALLLYVSDHGESLGEKGLYLHGAPYMLAPDEQKHVPLLLWLSPEYNKRFGVSPACVDAKRAQAFTHDNLYHTVLGAVGVKSTRYLPQLDMLATCRSAEAAAGGEVMGMK
ncbi:MAG: lipid ethanolaminephosphotransferase [Betaproteobacteria bacterium]|nr:lipid ethanolaminephosphotransferase [Betaproteobacteria bacterium]